MKISLIVLQSLDGFIAKDQTDDLSWGTKEDKEFFRAFTKDIGTMVMGSNTFESMPEKAFSGRKALVFTSNPDKYRDYKNSYGEVEFFKGTPIEGVENLLKKGIDEIALIGGGNINNQFLEAKLVTDLYVTIAPKIFGQGIKGFGNNSLNIDLKLEDFSELSQNELLVHYKVLN